VEDAGGRTSGGQPIYSDNGHRIEGMVYVRSLVEVIVSSGLQARRLVVESCDRIFEAAEATPSQKAAELALGGTVVRIGREYTFRTYGLPFTFLPRRRVH